MGHLTMSGNQFWKEWLILSESVHSKKIKNSLFFQYSMMSKTLSKVAKAILIFARNDALNTTESSFF